MRAAIGSVGETLSAPGGETAATWIASRNEDDPDLTMSIDLNVAEGNTVATYMTSTGTNQDDDEAMGAPATGKQAENVGQEQGDLGGRVVEARTLQTLRETPYAALQAVAELVDHAGRANAQVAAGSPLFGAGAETKQRAWRAALWAVARDGDSPGEEAREASLAVSDDPAML